MTFWTETAIAQHLDGRFYQLQQKSLGTFAVIDLNELEEDEPCIPLVQMVPVSGHTKPRRADGSLWMDDISAVVSSVFNVSRLELESIRRAHHIVRARQVLFWIAKKYTSQSFPFIGAWVGRDHTTVLYAVEKIDSRFDEYREEIEQCLSRLGVLLNQEAA